MTPLFHPRLFLKFSLVLGATIVAAGLLANGLGTRLLPQAHAVQSAEAAFVGETREFSAKKKKRKRKKKRRSGRRGGLGGDFEGGAGGSYHTNSLEIGPEKLAAP